MEIDHVFIFTGVKARAGDALVDFGLREGSGNSHPGQGTANRRFFFHNFMLELLWIENMEEATNEKTAPLQFDERFLRKSEKTSPFGLIFRPAGEADTEPPFPSWAYKSDYLPEGLQLWVAKDTALSEPLYFYFPFADRANCPEPPAHDVHLKAVTAVAVRLHQSGELSQAAKIINLTDAVKILAGCENVLEIEFDHGVQGNRKDFRPELPLVFRW